MVTSSRLTVVLAFTLGFGSSRDASAQVEHPWSADIAVGAAPVNGGDYLSLSHAAAHLSVAERLLQRGGLAMVAEAGYDWLGRFYLLGANGDLECLMKTPGGGCEPNFPNVSGPAASIGLLYVYSTRVETRVGVGGAAYLVDSTRVGAAVGQLDAALFPAPHLGLILGARFEVIPRYRHDRLMMVPVLLGLRVR